LPDTDSYPAPSRLHLPFRSCSNKSSHPANAYPSYKSRPGQLPSQSRLPVQADLPGNKWLQYPTDCTSISCLHRRPFWHSTRYFQKDSHHRMRNLEGFHFPALPRIRESPSLLPPEKLPFPPPSLPLPPGKTPPMPLRSPA